MKHQRRGNHEYKGKFHCRGQRTGSKIRAGLKPDNTLKLLEILRVEKLLEGKRNGHHS